MRFPLQVRTRSRPGSAAAICRRVVASDEEVGCGLQERRRASGLYDQCVQSHIYLAPAAWWSLEQSVTRRWKPLRGDWTSAYRGSDERRFESGQRREGSSARVCKCRLSIGPLA